MPLRTISCCIECVVRVQGVVVSNSIYLTPETSNAKLETRCRGCGRKARIPPSSPSGRGSRTSIAASISSTRGWSKDSPTASGSLAFTIHRYPPSDTLRQVKCVASMLSVLSVHINRRTCNPCRPVSYLILRNIPVNRFLVTVQSLRPKSACLDIGLGFRSKV